MSLLTVEDLRVHFKTDRGTIRAVDGVSFKVGPGETLGIVGESGSGKSVTSMAIMGLLPSPPAQVFARRVRLGSLDLLAAGGRGARQVRGHKLAMIFQDPMTSLNPFLRVSRQLTEVLEAHRGLRRKAALRAAIEMLERVGIPDPAKRVHSYPHEFSGGMRQRVMIAMSLLCEPELLIADEPTTALDVTIQAQILELLKDLQRERGMSIILITHDLGVVAGMSDRIMVMYGGRIMERASARRLFKTPGHPYTRGLLKSVPRLDEAVTEQLYSIPGLPPVMTEDVTGCPFADRCAAVQARCQRAFPHDLAPAADHEVNCWVPLEERT